MRQAWPYRREGWRVPDCAKPGDFIGASVVGRDTDYGYLWWLQTFQVGGKPVKSWGMYGTGGNKVYVLPDLDTVIVVTTTNFRVPHAGDLTDKLFTSLLVPAIARS